MAEEGELVTDPMLIQQLNQAVQNSRKYLSDPAPSTSQTPVGQDAQGNPTSATPASARAALLSGQDPRGQYTGANYPGAPQVQGIQGGLNALGTGLQMFGGAIPAAVKKFPMLGRAVGSIGDINKIGSVPNKGAMMASRAAPAVAEAAVTGAGVALQGGSPTEVGIISGIPIAQRVFYNNILRNIGKGAVGALTPDQTQVALMKNIDKKYGPGFIAAEKFETQIRPHNDMFVMTPHTSAAVRAWVPPVGDTTAEQTVASRMATILSKYRPPRQPGNIYSSHLGVGNAPPAMLATADNKLGAMYDDMKMLDEVAKYARENNLKNYAEKIMNVKEGFLDDMTKAVDGLKDARIGMYKEGSVHRLYEIMKSEKPSVEWFMAKDSSIFRKAYTQAEREDIGNTMDILSSLGGGSQWLGRILGHAATTSIFGAALGGAAGGMSGGMAGAGIGAAGGGAMGALLPYVIGEALAKPNGRKFMVSLMKRDPIGFTPAGLNALAQWFIADRQRGQGVSTPADIKEQRAPRPVDDRF